jgi:DNA repair protein RecO (recombination protein O)
MDQTFNTRAIILDRKDYREDDSRIVVFSQDKGKMNLIVRGAKKLKSKLSGHVEPLTLSRLMVVKGKELDYVGTAKGEEFYLDIREDLFSLRWAGRAIKALDDMSREGEEGDHSALFSWLSEYLSLLPTIPVSRREAFFWLAAMKLMALQGFGSDFGHCSACGNSSANVFSLSDKSVFCRSCLPSEFGDVISIERSFLDILSLAANQNLTDISKADILDRMGCGACDFLEKIYNYQ